MEMSSTVPPHAHGPRVLVVEDEPLVRRSLMRLLRRHGFDTREATDVETALVLLRDDGPFSAIIGEARMSRSGGTPLLEAARDEHPDVPLVLLTTGPVLGPAIAALRRGAFACVAKPFDADHVITEITRAAYHHALGRAILA